MRAALAAVAVTSVLAIGVAQRTARAQAPSPWDDLSETTTLPTPTAAGELLWSMRGACRGASGSFNRMQCEALRARARDQVSGAVYRLDLPALVQLGPFSKKKRSAIISVHGCIDCSGNPKLVVGSGRIVRDGKVALGPVLKSYTTVFKDATGYAKRRTMLARARTELLFSVGSAGGSVVTFRLVGFRTYDPCDGSIVLADPASEDRSPNARLCPAKPAK